MADPVYAPDPADRAEIHIDAPPAVVWAIVTDVAGMGRLSPECTGGRWLDGGTGPTVGGRFKGTNRRGWMRWSTTNTVVAADPGREFAFETKQSGIRWSYTLTPDADGTGTTVVEQRQPFRSSPLTARLGAPFLGGAEGHADELRAGMKQTLERLKAVAEAEAASA